MNMKKIIAAALHLAMLLTAAPAHAAELPKLASAWMGEFETFVAWYAKNNGWDKEQGFELNMIPFDSGKSIVESLAATNWSVAGCGAVPSLIEPLSDYVYIIAAANDESASNAVYVRKDSPILKIRGNNPLFPNVYGSAETVANKKIVYTKNTSGHYLLSNWLKILGLSEKDVVLHESEPTPALSAFTGGDGDIITLWAPFTFEAENKGFQTAAKALDCGLTQYVFLLANKNFADKNPEQTTAFLRMYMKGLEHIKNTDSSLLAKDYVRFYKEWTGNDLPESQAKLDIRRHIVFSLEEQLEMFAPNGKIQQYITDMINYTIEHGEFSPREIDRMKANSRITDSYLRALMQ